MNFFLFKSIYLFKSLYQTCIINFIFLYFKIFESKTDQYKLVKERLKKRNFIWKKEAPIRVFAIFSINNWEYQLLDPLKSLGEVYHFSWKNINDFFKKKSEWEFAHNKINNDLIAKYDNFVSDDYNNIVFLYTSDFIVSKSTMNHFRNSNTLVISFCWDDILYFKGKINRQPVGVSQLSKLADINLTFSPETISRYNFYKSPCFFWHSIPKKLKELPTINNIVQNNFYVLFIGSKYGHRETFINKLIKVGIPMRCFGKGWSNGAISDEQMQEEIKLAPLTLGFSNVGYTRNITTIKGRDFEVPLYGGLYLTQYSNGLGMYYNLNEEILSYNSLADCIKLIYWVKEFPDKAKIIRDAGFKKAIEKCSWDSRMIYLNNLINQCVNEL